MQKGWTYSKREGETETVAGGQGKGEEATTSASDRRGIKADHKAENRFCGTGRRVVVVVAFNVACAVAKTKVCHKVSK